MKTLTAIGCVFCRILAAERVCADSYTVTIPGGGFALIANQFNNGNALDSILPNGQLFQHLYRHQSDHRADRLQPYQYQLSGLRRHDELPLAFLSRAAGAVAAGYTKFWIWDEHLIDAARLPALFVWPMEKYALALGDLLAAAIANAGQQKLCGLPSVRTSWCFDHVTKMCWLLRNAVNKRFPVVIFSVARLPHVKWVSASPAKRLPIIGERGGSYE